MTDTAQQIATTPGHTPSATDMRRAVLAALFGNLVEWYDFVVYGLLATTIAARFFTGANGSGGAAPLLLTFATFGVGFVARPVGGLVIGLYGDRRGRKPALLLSITLMGLSTGLIAVIPSYSAIGVAAPLALVFARLVQGFAAGGEWGGAASFLVEWAPRNRRGLMGSIHPATIFVGTLAGSLVIAALTSLTGSAYMDRIGFRIPFVIGALIALVAIPFRLRAQETPAFAAEKDPEVQGEAPAVTPMPRAKLVRRLVQTFCLVAMQSAAVYTFTSYFPSFAKKYVHTGSGLTGSGQALWSNAIASVVVIGVVLLSGAVSDRVGRKPGMLTSCLLVLVLTAPLIVLVLHTRSFLALVLIQCVLAASVAIFLGCLASMLAELFPTRMRVAGLSSAYNLASAVFGGFAPLIAVALIGATGKPAAASIWVVFAAVVSTVAVLTYRETRGTQLA